MDFLRQLLYNLTPQTKLSGTQIVFCPGLQITMFTHMPFKANEPQVEVLPPESTPTTTVILHFSPSSSA